MLHDLLTEGRADRSRRDVRDVLTLIGLSTGLTGRRWRGRWLSGERPAVGKRARCGARPVGRAVMVSQVASWPVLVLGLMGSGVTCLRTSCPSFEVVQT